MLFVIQQKKRPKPSLPTIAAPRGWAPRFLNGIYSDLVQTVRRARHRCLACLHRPSMDGERGCPPRTFERRTRAGKVEKGVLSQSGRSRAGSRGACTRRVWGCRRAARPFGQKRRPARSQARRGTDLIARAFRAVAEGKLVG